MYQGIGGVFAGSLFALAVLDLHGAGHVHGVLLGDWYSRGLLRKESFTSRIALSSSRKYTSGDIRFPLQTSPGALTSNNWFRAFGDTTRVRFS